MEYYEPRNTHQTQTYHSFKQIIYDTFAQVMYNLPPIALVPIYIHHKMARFLNYDHIQTFSNTTLINDGNKRTHNKPLLWCEVNIF